MNNYRKWNIANVITFNDCLENTKLYLNRKTLAHMLHTAVTDNIKLFNFMNNSMTLIHSVHYTCHRL